MLNQNAEVKVNCLISILNDGKSAFGGKSSGYHNEIQNLYLAGESRRKIVKVLGISRKTVDKYCEGTPFFATPFRSERSIQIRLERSFSDTR